MILLPAIDLIAGRCVRLAQGAFDHVTDYSGDPAAALAGFASAGASEVHIVDLDGARAGEPRQTALLDRLARSSPLRLQVAGGLRSEAQVETLIAAGVARVVIGSLALIDPDRFRAMIDRFGPDRMTLALDVRMEGGEAMVATHGWARTSARTLGNVLAGFLGIRHLLVTDIARDGMLEGPNAPLMERIVADFPEVELQASGGVASLADLDLLRSAGARRAIVGKAIWEQRFTAAEGLARARG